MKFTDGQWMARAGLTLHRLEAIGDYHIDANGVTLYVPTNRVQTRGDTLNATMITLRFTAPREEIIRVQISHFDESYGSGPHFTIYEQGGFLPAIEDLEDKIVLHSGQTRVEIAKSGKLHYAFYHGARLLTECSAGSMAYIIGPGRAEIDRVNGNFAAYAPDWQRPDRFIREQFSLSVGENIYGLGERFTPLVRNGQSVDIWNKDGGTGSDQSYKNIPFFLSNRGYGVFANHPEQVSYEVGSELTTKTQVSVPGETLDYFVLGGSDMKGALSNYTALTGRANLPPAWSFGLWLSTSFTTDYDEQTVTRFIDGMAQRDIPLSVFHYDCFWMREYQWCDFEWDKRFFPDPEGMLARLKAKGLKICVWINPYIGQKSKLFAEGKAAGYLVKRLDGSVWQFDMWQPGMALVDFTNPQACAWYASKLEALLEMGVDCFKTDFGERIPVDVQYYDGSDPAKMHNYYTHLYNKVVFDLLCRVRGRDEAVVFARSATAGGQAFPVHWGGDCTATYPSMAESLRGGLSFCMSGFGFWSHDIGGFEQTAPPDVYKRWAAFGLLSSHSRLHGSNSYRVPWNFDDEAVDVVRYFTHLKCALMPYLYGQAVKTAQTGIPMMRAMVLEFPQDAACAALERQYMLGDNLLVAPIFSADNQVTYYLPEGRWTHLLNGKVYEGGRFYTEEYGFLSLPLFVRPGSILPIGNQTGRPDYDFADHAALHLYGFEDGMQACCIVPDQKGACALEAQAACSGGVLTVHVRTDKPYSLVLHGAVPQAVEGAAFEETQEGVLLTGCQSCVKITL